jgi:SAM-dependent methyltransferase
MPRRPVASRKRDVSIFEHDAAAHGGYLYTAGASLSSRLATARSLDLILDAALFAGRSVIDMGCGDGHFTRCIWSARRPQRMVGVDAAGAAVRRARRSCTVERIEYAVGDLHHLPFPDDSFDVALLQSTLHHDDDPADVIREAFRLAGEVVIHEPNGNNLGLKLIERTSRYHRAHDERSYRPAAMVRWVQRAGGEVRALRFAGLVPIFCPDWMAALAKRLEPAVERTPILRSQAAAVYVIVAGRRTAVRPSNVRPSS